MKGNFCASFTYKLQMHPAQVLSKTLPELVPKVRSRMDRRITKGMAAFYSAVQETP